MFIGQGSSIDGVCMVYGLNPFVHHSNCLYNPINSKEEKNTQLREREAIKQRDRRIRYKQQQGERNPVSIGRNSE
jgi:hypothetical protein